MLQTKNYNLIIEKENLNKNNFIGSGFSGKVYYYKNNNSQLAIKIFDDYYLSFYDNKMEEFENLYKSFQQINTEYILMPQYLLYAYTMFEDESIPKNRTKKIF